METFFEYVVKPPRGFKKIKSLKIKLIIIYCAFCAVALGAVFFSSKLNALAAPAAVLTGIFCFVIYYLTWPKTKPEYEYSIELGRLRLSAIYGGRIRRIIVKTELREAELIAPNNGMYENKIKDFAPEREYSGTFSDGQKNYFMLFRNERDEKSVLYFWADVEKISQFKRYNGKTIVDRTSKSIENE